MKYDKRTLVHGSLAALAAAAFVTVAPALAQTSSQATPPAQTYQNGAMTSGTSAMKSAATESLSQVQNAKTTLASAMVKDSNGQQIGQVQTVHTGRTGKPTKIDVTLSSGNGGQAKTVAVKASELKYDQNSNTLVTNLTSTQLEAMPAASTTGM